MPAGNKPNRWRDETAYCMAHALRLSPRCFAHCKRVTPEDVYRAALDAFHHASDCRLLIDIIYALHTGHLPAQPADPVIGDEDYDDYDDYEDYDRWWD